MVRRTQNALDAKPDRLEEPFYQTLKDLWQSPSNKIKIMRLLENKIKMPDENFSEVILNKLIEISGRFVGGPNGLPNKVGKDPKNRSKVRNKFQNTVWKKSLKDKFSANIIDYNQIVINNRDDNDHDQQPNVDDNLDEPHPIDENIGHLLAVDQDEAIQYENVEYLIDESFEDQTVSEQMDSYESDHVQIVDYMEVDNSDDIVIDQQSDVVDNLDNFIEVDHDEILVEENTVDVFANDEAQSSNQAFDQYEYDHDYDDYDDQFAAHWLGQSCIQDPLLDSPILDDDVLKNRPFLCDICQRRFTRKQDLISHNHIHTGEKPYDCKIYGKSFRHKSSLIFHNRIHTGEKPYDCKICGKSFRIAAKLKDHNRIHTGEKPYDCKICGQGFSQKVSLTDHVRIYHDEILLYCDFDCLFECKYNQQLV
jgi:hypothetical protein